MQSPSPQLLGFHCALSRGALYHGQGSHLTARLGRELERGAQHVFDEERGRCHWQQKVGRLARDAQQELVAVERDGGQCVGRRTRIAAAARVSLRCMIRSIRRACCALAAAVPLAAQVPPTSALQQQPDMLHLPGQNVTVSLLTVGNGDQVWELFGHTAISIHDNISGRDTAFNWGEFDRSRPLFVLHFLIGPLLYQMGGETMADLLFGSRHDNRSVTSQELDLSPAQKDSLLAIIAWYARPENIQYRYDEFADNCSTRPRDILDRVLAGQLRPGADRLTITSYRWHTLRLMQGDKLLTVGVDIALGEPSDRPITIWQEMFLPRKLHDWVATVQVRDERGAMRPLVRSERVLVQSTRPPEPDAAPTMKLWLTPIGVVVALVLAWLGIRAMDERRGTRLAAAIVFATWAGACGVLGVILTVLSAVSHHRFAHANENLFLFNPLWLIAAVLLPVLYASGRAARATYATMMLIAGLGVVALLSHLVQLSRQSNLGVIGLALPPALVLTWLVKRNDRNVNPTIVFAVGQHVLETLTLMRSARNLNRSA